MVLFHSSKLIAMPVIILSREGTPLDQGNKFSQDFNEILSEPKEPGHAETSVYISGLLTHLPTFVRG